MKNYGFSLVELIIVIAIIGTLLSISTLSFNSWQKKYAIEKQTKEMVADFSTARIMSIHKKKRHVVTINPTNYIFAVYSSESDATGTVSLTKNVSYQIQTSVGLIDIDSRGFTNSNQTIKILPSYTGAAVDCLTVSVARINIGKVQTDGSCLYK